jgi:multiple sugar transport system substrate-binding protein
MMKKKIIRNISFLFIALLLCGCNATTNLPQQTEISNKSETVTINFLNWAIAEEISAQPLLNVEKEYMDSHDIKIKNLTTTWQDMKYAVFSSLISKEQPDVIQLASPWFKQVYATNELEPLNDYIDESTLKIFDKQLLEEYTIDGKLYALPWIDITLNVFWNKNVLSKANIKVDNLPKTIDEFKDIVTKIGSMPMSGERIYGFGLPTAKDEITVNIFNALLKAEGTDFLDKDNRISVDYNKLTDLLNWYWEMGVDGIIPKDMSIKDQYSLFVNNGIAGFFDGLYARNYLRLTSGKGTAYDDNIIVTPFPSGENRVAANNDQILVLLKNSKNKQASADFISYLCADENATQEYYSGSGFAPASSLLLSDSLYIKDDIARVYAESISYKFNYSIADTIYYYDALEYISTGINLVASGKMTAKEGSNYIMSQLEDLYRK